MQEWSIISRLNEVAKKNKNKKTRKTQKKSFYCINNNILDYLYTRKVQLQSDYQWTEVFVLSTVCWLILSLTINNQKAE